VEEGKKYYPGRLIVGFPSMTSQKQAEKVITELGGVMDNFHKPGVSDVLVPPDKTLEIYEKFSACPLVRFVSLDLVERSQNH